LALSAMLARASSTLSGGPAGPLQHAPLAAATPDPWNILCAPTPKRHHKLSGRTG
jgi:hypothetical protein